MSKFKGSSQMFMLCVDVKKEINLSQKHSISQGEVNIVLRL